MARIKGPAARAMRSLLYAAQRGRCGICGGKLYGARFCSIDHVVPHSVGGRNKGNLLLVHRPCTAGKANRMPTGCELIMLAAVNARLPEIRCQFRPREVAA